MLRLIVIIGMALGMYCYVTDFPALTNWLKQGREHYELMVQFNQLGGVDGAILKVQERLALHPEDAEGWRILGKLYLSKGDTAKADWAFGKAH